MTRFSSASLREWTEGRWVGGEPDGVSGFSNDTRALRPGEMFVALRTARRDGHDFLADARASGARAALTAREVAGAGMPQLVVDDPLESLQRVAAVVRGRFPGPVVGVTGSVGKTSTKDLLKLLLGGEAAHATHANLNNLLGVPLTVLASDPSRHSAMVVEAGMSEPGELERAAWIIRPDIAVVTNVQPAHLEGLGSLDAIAREKSALCRQVAATGEAVFPADCLRHPDFRRLLCRRTAVVFEGDAVPELRDGLRDAVRAGIAPEGEGWRLTLESPLLGRHVFSVGAVSAGMVRNAALASVAALRLRVPAERVAATLAGWAPSPGRGDVRLFGDRVFQVDCYNASPASMLDSAACFVRRTPASSPRLFVLGGMNELGGASAALHREVGRALPLRPGDTLALFGGLSAEIGVGATESGFPASSVARFDTIEALREAVRRFPGSVMLKGSRGYALERALPPEIGGDAPGH